MKVIHVPENNLKLLPPENWDEERNGPCETISAHRDGTGTVVTFEFEAEEFAALLRGGKVRLKVWGPAFPPVALWVAS